MIMTMRYDAPPEKRGLMKFEGKPVWMFPEDYPQRARAAAARLYGTP